MLARRAFQIVDQARRLLDDLLHGRVLAVENAQRVGVQPPPGLFVQQFGMLLEVGDQVLTMAGALGRIANGVDLQLQPFDTQVIPETLAHGDDFGIDFGAAIAQSLDTHLMELAIAAALGTLVPEHGPQVPEATRTIVEQVVLDDGTHHAGGAFGTQGEFLTIEGIAEGVHLLLDDVGDGAQAPGEQGGGFDDGRADLAVAIAARPGGDDFLEALPARRGLRQQVVHAFDAGEFLSCHRGMRVPARKGCAACQCGNARQARHSSGECRGRRLRCGGVLFAGRLRWGTVLFAGRLR